MIPRSGATPEVPSLLRYACDLRTNIGLLPPARAAAPLPSPGSGEEGSPEVLAALMGGRPLVTLEFAQMEVGRGRGRWRGRDVARGWGWVRWRCAGRIAWS